jgi:hypothetical protein
MAGIGELAGISGNIDASGNGLFLLIQRAYEKLTICKTKHVCSCNPGLLISYIDKIKAIQSGREVCGLA